MFKWELLDSRDDSDLVLSGQSDDPKPWIEKIDDNFFIRTTPINNTDDLAQAIGSLPLGWKVEFDTYVTSQSDNAVEICIFIEGIVTITGVAD